MPSPSSIKGRRDRCSVSPSIPLMPLESLNSDHDQPGSRRWTTPGGGRSSPAGVAGCPRPPPARFCYAVHAVDADDLAAVRRNVLPAAGALRAQRKRRISSRPAFLRAASAPKRPHHRPENQNSKRVCHTCHPVASDEMENRPCDCRPNQGFERSALHFLHSPHISTALYSMPVAALITAVQTNPDVPPDTGAAGAVPAQIATIPRLAAAVANAGHAYGHICSTSLKNPQASSV